MVHLTIDIGNTATKAAIHRDATTAVETAVAPLRTTAPHRHRKVDGHALCWIASFIEGCGVEAAIVSSTVDITDAMRSSLDSLGIPQLLYLDQATPVPIRNSYLTPETLGPDRLAAAIGAYYESFERTGKHNPVLIVDAGTAITYDLVTSDGEYLGGNISPGINLRFLSLHEHTAHLPLVNMNAEEWESSPYREKLAGGCTEQAILHGVLDGVRHEIEGFICEFSLKYPHLLVFLTGGNALNFSESIKNRTFADEFLVSKGLDIVLQYNLQRTKDIFYNIQ